MLRLMSALALCALATAAWASDAPPPAAIEAAAPKLSFVMLDEFAPKTGNVNFFAGDMTAPPPALTQRLLVVFLDGAQTRPKGVAYAYVTLKLECYPHTAKVAGYEPYDANGKALKALTKLPAHGETWIDGYDLVTDHANQCRRAMPGRELPPVMLNPPPRDAVVRPNLSYFPSPRVTSLSEALALAQTYSAQADLARKSPLAGALAVGEVEADWGVVVLDTATLKRDDAGNARVSWMLVRKAVGGGATHIRVTHKLDCAARKALPETTAAFDAQGRLVAFHTGGRAQSFQIMTGINQVYDKICDDVPVETGPTVATEAEALTAANAKLAP